MKLKIITFLLFQLFFTVVDCYSLKKPDFICIDSLTDYRHKTDNPYSSLSLHKIQYIDSLNAVRVLIKMTSDNGYVIQNSTDSGYNWETSYVDTSYTYIDTNGKKQYYFPNHQFEEMYYISKDSCLIACNKGLTLFSKDNCKNWEKIYDSVNITYYFFLGRDPIVKSLWNTLTGYPQIENKRFTTTDKGKSWEQMQFLEENLYDYYHQIQIIDSNTIFFPFFNEENKMITKPMLYYIREKKWEKLPVTDGFSGFLNTETLSKYDFTRVIERMIDSIPYRYIIRTRDGGYNWDTLFKIQNQGIYRIKYFDSLNVIAFGPTYVLIKSIDGGQRWDFQKVENYSHEQSELDTTWYYLMFYQACWPEINSIYVTASSSFLYKYVGHLNSIPDDNEMNKHLKVYPNPAHKSESLNVMLSGLDENNYTLEVIDLMGRKYYNLDSYFSSISTLLQIDTRNINLGTYFLILKNQEKIISINKFIIH
ncbi:MAG: hypothetical protein A2X64_06735 [Ignavibacteria bacterium GWF2_33_9]|nr:MAG: hypothetical protein A2X64_06735 [Ignavibacteria bacterium GWF2_33_9]